jgi:hypothetical protein
VRRITATVEAFSMATTDTDALALLPLPSPETLTESQLCGRSCVWCWAPLSNDTAIDLGKRTSDAHGSTASWFPRACLDCMQPHVLQTAAFHARTCEQCVDDAASTDKSVCDTARTLRRLTLEHAR